MTSTQQLISRTLSVKPTVDFKKTQAPSSSCSDPSPRKPIIIKIKLPKIVSNTDLSETPAPATAPALTGNKNRDYIRENFATWLSKAAEEAGGGRNKVAELSEIIETNLYNAWGLCNGPKKPSYFSMLSNLRDPKNPDFRKKILNGFFSPEKISRFFSPEKISSLTTKDMASEARKLEDQKILDAKRERESRVTKDAQKD